MSKHKILRQGRRIQIRNESTVRINTLHIYPFESSNGSRVTIHGTDQGLRVTWAGGRPLYFHSRNEAAHTSGVQTTGRHYTEHHDSEDEALFESDSEDADDDAVSAKIVQEIDLSLDSPVIDLAVPPLPSRTDLEHGLPAGPKDHANLMIIAVACADGSCQVMTLPLDPPSHNTKRKGKYGARFCTLLPASPGIVSRGISLRQITNHDSGETRRSNRPQTRRATDQAQDGKDSLLVSVATSEFSGYLQVFRIPLVQDDKERRRMSSNGASLIHTAYLNALPTALSLNPASSTVPRHNQLLTSDISGHTTIFDLQPHSSSAEPSQPAIIAQLSTPYSPPSPSTPIAPHKPILSTEWVLAGTATLTLLSDGTFGLHALTASPPTNHSTSSPLSFACTGFIGSPIPLASTSSSGLKKAHLAPMTPNTRRTKSASLFSGSTSASSDSGPARGGIATHPLSSSNGTPDDAVALWFGNRVYAIPSLREYWAMSARREGGGGLYGTGIVALGEVDLSGEVVTSLAIVPGRRGEEARGGREWGWDVLVGGEYRTVLVCSGVERRERVDGGREVEEGSPSRVDGRLLERGELGLDGVERMLDSMVGVEMGRRVGFLEG